MTNKAIEQLLFQLADDDYIFAYRGSEWLGLAPHIEEDVAFSSITQDTMGHASMYYNLLEKMGVGQADELSQLRKADERKNCILVERKNGEGYYMGTVADDNMPKYDWAYAVVRNYLYTTAKKVKINSLKESANEDLRNAAIKINMELFYHLIHWKTWFVQLFTATEDARTRMTAALEKVVADFGDVFSYGEVEEALVDANIIASNAELKEKWFALITPVFEQIDVALPEIPQPELNGRLGQHTEVLEQAVETMSEVFRSDVAAAW